MPNFENYAIFGVLVALWSQIRSVIDRIRATLITNVLLDGEVAKAVRSYLYEHGTVWDWGDRYIHSLPSFVRPLDRVTEIAIEGPPKQARLVWCGWKPVLFSSAAGESGRPHDHGLLTLSYIRGSLDIVELTKLALHRSMQKNTSGQRYRVRRIVGRSRQDQHGGMRSESPPVGGSTQPYCVIGPSDRLLHWQHTDIGAPIPDAPFESLVLEPPAQLARSEFERWLGMRQWYKQRSIPWRRGFLFCGSPGTGKTSLARALAQTGDIPVFVYDLATLSNEEFSREWQEMQEQTPCMALLEDIDSCFRGRVNNNSNPDAMTFDCLLNAISGIQSADGVFLIVTTNHREHLDPALTRPGRIDRQFLLGLPSEQSREQILDRIAGHSTDVAKTNNMTVAEVTEFAVAKALDQAWNSDARTTAKV